MSLFNKNIRNMLNTDKTETAVETRVEEPEKVYREIIAGILFDTSKAEKISEVYAMPPGYSGIYFNGMKTTIYEGKRLWFTVCAGQVVPVTDEWVRDIIGRTDPDKYIEIFGEPEMA